MDKKQGFTTIYHEYFPADWIKPGGTLDQEEYHLTCKEIQNSRDTIARKEMKSPKSCRKKSIRTKK